MNDQPTPQAETPRDVPSGEAQMLGLDFAMELGYTIAVPVVILAIGGAYLDKHFHTSPLFLLLGVLLAFTISAIAVTKKVRSILNRMPKVMPKPPVDEEAISESEAFHKEFQSKS